MPFELGQQVFDVDWQSASGPLENGPFNWKALLATNTTIY
jgi:hypothetical protein